MRNLHGYVRKHARSIFNGCLIWTCLHILPPSSACFSHITACSRRMQYVFRCSMRSCEKHIICFFHVLFQPPAARITTGPRCDRLISRRHLTRVQALLRLACVSDSIYVHLLGDTNMRWTSGALRLVALLRRHVVQKPSGP